MQVYSFVDLAQTKWQKRQKNYLKNYNGHPMATPYTTKNNLKINVFLSKELELLGYDRGESRAGCGDDGRRPDQIQRWMDRQQPVICEQHAVPAHWHGRVAGGGHELLPEKSESPRKRW